MRINFSIKENDPALAIIQDADNQSAYIREACVFKHKYENEPVELALNWYKQSESLADLLTDIIDAKLDELASKLADKGVNVSQEVAEVKSDRVKVSNMLSQFDGV